MPPLEGRAIALLESRMGDELATMIRRLGGVPVSAPAVREVPRLEEVAGHITSLAAGEYRVAVFLTGVGAAALLGEADRRGELPRVVAVLEKMTVAARGPKPLAALKRYGVPVSVVTAKPHTSRELLAALEAVEMRDVRVLLVHYGERSVEIGTALRGRGARLDEACPYEWALPDDPQPLAALVRDTLERRLDAMLFTSQVQCRHLFDVAREMHLSHELAATLNRHVIVGAVGPVCASALRQLGVTPHVMPGSPNMASLITAVADYFSLTAAGSEGAGT
jgi:uroporphyrinogen-III synthase